MTSAAATLLEHFAHLEDPRVERTKEHLLIDIIGITICGVICGADSWVDIEHYGNAKLEWLQQFLKLPNGIPSHDTLARVFARLEPESLQNCFLSWIRAISELSVGEIIALDGKTLRQSYQTGGSRGAIHMVSAWACQNRLVLGQVKVDDKSNEITAIPRLLEVLAITGCIVTIDAMGCQKAIAKLITDRQGDYVLALKANQGKLYEDVVQLFAAAQRANFQDMEHDFYQSVNGGHGRTEIRQHWTLGQVSDLANAQQWQGFQTVGMVQFQRRVNGCSTTETRYYLLSLPSQAQRFAQAVRSHWGIENCVHWVLDGAFHEDACRVRKDHAPQNLALVRHIALNLLTQETSSKGGVKAKRLKAGWDNDYLAKVLAQ